MRQQLFRDPTALKQLTPREKSVLTAAKRKQSLNDIAEDLNVPQSIVVRHIANIVTKIDGSDQRLAYQLLYSYKLDRRS